MTTPRTKNIFSETDDGWAGQGDGRSDGRTRAKRLLISAIVVIAAIAISAWLSGPPTSYAFSCTQPATPVPDQVAGC